MQEFNAVYQDEIEERVYIEGIEAKKSGSKIVGVYCAFTPHELIAAADAIPVSLCAGSEKPIPFAEKHLPRNLCPLVKSSYGYAINGECPYFNSTDFLIADSTCDGKKKMFELMSKVKPLFLMMLPQNYIYENSKKYWLQEIYQIRDSLEALTGNKITDGSLSNQIKLYNRYRQTVRDIFELNLNGSPKLSGSEINAIMGSAGFEIHLESRIKEMNEAKQMVLARSQTEKWRHAFSQKPRILLTGCPTTNKKVIEAIEAAGGVVCAMESCGGLKTAGDLVDENGNPWEALAEHYIQVACPCMSPNPRRLEILSNLVEDYQVEGVLELVWQGCHTYNVESHQIKKHVQERHQMPYLLIETDYSESDNGQIRLRVEAFLELIKEKNNKRKGDTTQ
ncbi:double-cubane-cluster-containing anaerobic reductase [Acidaminobacter sp.]|uniref:double-cubane-cluster-containing anaerobic reductase n=1 Tax=Acidaminobacter sp. TaxID=1872102 RepID=UPI00137DD129|nr:double-cubane-cluster-containing anaerobic reductase [Acidaminobacter sp.]MDK9710136.1 double-cubane-cluster-containing anaerobic reductase [Acidaminobacter sp.]MZQ98778.1 2-hydroxyacyl-CoA dehydratase [Acidaminobacter sp.]